MRIGVDAGGTFTDFVVLHDSGAVETFKLRSNPRAPEEVILAGLARATEGAVAEVIHGSTVATNALLERKGARTAFVTTAGFEDLVLIGRQNRRQLYHLTPRPERPLVGADDCFGVPERTLFDGSILRHASAAVGGKLRRRLRREGYQAVAICFLHSYQNPENERMIAAQLDGAFYCCPSHEICPEFREYERASTTLINAYVGPLMRSYLERLAAGCPHRLFIVQSNGGMIQAQEAARLAVRTILSGPAGGVVGAVEVARAAGYTRVIGLDMGGTSTDVCLCDGAPQETAEAYVDGLPIRAPMLDIHTVGAGGGSLARIDAGGLLRVGPESAGADPGPACYGVGEKPTVTDAHVVLGRISATQLLGGDFALNPERALAAVEPIAAQLGVEAPAAAEAILQVANANMQRAIRAVSVERGFDPRDFALLAFGGCGGLHACELAEELGIRVVISPAHAGVLSALGMLMADRVRDYAAAALGRGDHEERFEELEWLARQQAPGAKLERYADVRYAGQSYELTIPWRGRKMIEDFHAAHERHYGYARPAAEVEIVTLRLRSRLRTRKPGLQQSPPPAAVSAEGRHRRVWMEGRWRRVPVYARHEIGSRPQPGPALIADYGSTTLVLPGWTLRQDTAGSLILEQGGRRR